MRNQLLEDINSGNFGESYEIRKVSDSFIRGSIDFEEASQMIQEIKFNYDSSESI